MENPLTSRAGEVALRLIGLLLVTLITISRVNRDGLSSGWSVVWIAVALILWATIAVAERRDRRDRPAGSTNR